MSDFKSLLSVFQDATGSTAPPKKSGNNSNGGDEGTSGSNQPITKDSNNQKNNEVDLESSTDPNFSATLMKQRIERLLRIQQIRKSTVAAGGSVGSLSINASDGQPKNDYDASQSPSFHLAVCATTVEDFPHEDLWKRWMTSTTIDIPFVGNSSTEKETAAISCSAELYIHAKHAKEILHSNSNSSLSSFMKSKLLPFSHKPNWNDVRVIRAMLSLLQHALEDTKTTHVLFCTESCIPIVTLGEAARSILLDEFCLWEEKRKGGNNDDIDATAAAPTDTNTDTNAAPDDKTQEGMQNQPSSQKKQHQLNWNRSYIHCYNQNSPQCTRFDEHNCWSVLSNSIPPSAIHKALPGWCLLSRKHAQSILELPQKQLDGMNLWPAFERVWAPEEVYFPTALALCGYMDNEEEVSKRSVTHSEWDTRASNHKDRAHPLTYDDQFDEELVKRVRNENGALFMRKVKKELDLNVWEEIVIRRGKGCSSSSSSSSSRGGHYKRAAPSSTDARPGGNDYYDRDRDRGRSSYHGRNDNSRYHYDSRRNQYYGNSNNGRDRDVDRRHSSKRQRWR
mmetsp:Transcript_3673/g.5586  ORF Transcript_3673/g.5586 Transcript_3673/m.5586 type:complete len:563 (+) Transcript_3673:191-1879(+)